MRSRKTTIPAAGLTVALLAAACGGNGDEGSDRANSMYTWITNPSDRAQWEAFIEGAQQQDPDFHLDMEGPSFDDYWTAVHTRIAANDAPCILTTQAARAQELADVLMPLDDLVGEQGLDISQYNEAMIDGLTVDGELRGIPYDAQPVVMYYDKDAYAEAGLEEPGLSYTQEQYISDLQTIREETGMDGVSLSPSLGSSPGLMVAFANGNTPTAEGELQLTEAGFVEDMQWGFDLVAEHSLTSAPSSGDPVDINLSRFLSGETATYMDGTWFYETVVEELGESTGVTIVPSASGEPRGMIQGSAFGIAATCDDPEAAFENITAITTPEVLGFVGRERGVVPSIAEELDAWAEGKSEDVIEVTEALLANADALETTPGWNQVDTIFTSHSSDGYRGNRTAEEIMQTIEGSVR